MGVLTSKKVRFNVYEYFRMADAGVFNGRRVELLDGRVFRMNAQSDPHMIAIRKVGKALERHFGDDSKFWIISQGTYTIEPFDAPDPDYHVVNVPMGTPKAKRPRPFLVIEISVTTYKHDSGIKLRRYAAAGVRDYWIVNVPEHRVEVYRDPKNPTGRKRDWCYATPQYFAMNDEIALLAYPQIKLSVRDMMP
jgi:Uma2 family endonuclease